MIDIFFHDKTGVVSGFPGQIDGFEYADGNGEIHYYRLFDGVGIMLLRLEMEAYTEIRTQIGRLEVNFCVNGRFETSFSMRDRVLLKPGDMAVSCYDGFHGSSSASCFPLGYYEGICLEIEPASAGNWIKQNAPAFSVDFAAWKQNLLGCKWYMVGAAGPRCEHVFRELYESAFYESRLFAAQDAGTSDAAWAYSTGEYGGVILLVRADGSCAPSPGSLADKPGGIHIPRQPCGGA